MYQRPYRNYQYSNQIFPDVPQQKEKHRYQLRRIWKILPLLLATGFLLFLFVPMIPFVKIPLLVKGLSIGSYAKLGILIVIFSLIAVIAAIVLG